MYNLLIEDIKDLESITNYLEQLVVKLRRENRLSSKVLQLVRELYDDLIIPWYEQYFMLHKEMPVEDEQEMINLILEMISLLLGYKQD